MTVHVNTLPDIFAEKEKKKEKKKKAKKNKYYIHANTKNKSFLKLYRNLKILGIENNDFFLALYDPRIANLDPFDPNLTPEQQMLIMAECKRNFWYYARECVRIPVPGSSNLGEGGGKPYAIHRGNCALTWCILNNIDLFLELPRQNFKSVSVDVILGWLYICGTTNSSMLIMNKAHDDAKDNLVRIKEIRDALPYYLRRDMKKDANGKMVKVTENKEEITHHLTKNTLVTKPSATNKDAADKLGRGLTQPILWFDEFGFLKYNMIIYESASPAYRQAAIEAENNGKPHCKIITTTPGDMETEFGKDAFIFRNKCVKFKEEFYDWKIKDLKEFIFANSTNGFVHISFSFSQLGRSQKYLEIMESDLGGNWLKVRREVLLEWISFNSDSPFDKDDIEKIKELMKNKTPLRSVYIDKIYEFILYEEIDLSRKYILSCDVSTGTRRDYSTIVVIDSKTKKAVGEFRNNKIDTLAFSFVIHTIATQVLNSNCVICIERNNVGSSVITNLLRTEVRNLVYFENNKTILQEKIKKGREVTSDSETIKYGVWTDENRREEMFEILQRFVKNYKERVLTEQLCSEITSLIYNKKGRIDHPSDGHDDLVMGLLIGLWVYYHGNNISSFGLVRYPDIDPTNGMTEEEYLMEQEMLDIEKNNKRMKNINSILGDDDAGTSNHTKMKTISDYYDEIDRDMLNTEFNRASSTLTQTILNNNNNSNINSGLNLFNMGEPTFGFNDYNGEENMFSEYTRGDF